MEEKTDLEKEIKDLCGNTKGYGFDEESGCRVFGDYILFVSYYYDGDCSNPLEDCDGMGKITSFSRRHINSVNSQEEVDKLFEDPHAVALSYFEHGQCLWGVQGSMEGMPDFRWDGVSMAGVWTPDKYCREHIKSEAIKNLLPGVKVNYESVGDKLNSITATLPDGSKKHGYKNFVNAYRASACKLGVKLDKATLKKEEYKVARDCAKGACDVYTKWCNGECYGYLVDVYKVRREGSLVFNRLDDYRHDDSLCSDSCSGFIGQEFVESKAYNVAVRAINNLMKVEE